MYFSRFMPDFYRLVRPILFLLDPEEAHELSLGLIHRGFVPGFKNYVDAVLETKVAGMDFPNPIGLAAGFDKQAEVIADMLTMGFGFVEVGSITPNPQPGNAKPRVFRLEEQEAIINRFGFNSDGFEACALRLIAYRDATNRQVPGVVGVNIGKNKETTDAAQDYVAGVKKFKPYADYLAVNVSSPNTPGLRDLQGSPLMDLIRRVMDANAKGVSKPVFVKIAPDLNDQQVEDIARVALETGISGLIVGNTTLDRPPGLATAKTAEAGGLSGKPLFNKSTKLLSDVYRATSGKLPLIGCGGVSSGADAYEKIRAGASIVQLYTSLIFKGPFLIPRINRDLAERLKRDNFASVTEAVGADVTL